MSTTHISKWARRTLPALLLALAVLSSAIRAQAAAVTFAVGATNAVTNSVIVVPIRATNFTGVGSFSFSFHWSTNVASLVTVEQFGLPGMTTNDFGYFPASGTITVAWFEPNGGVTNVPDGGMLFGIRMHLVGRAADTCPVTIDGNPTALFAASDLAELPATSINNILSIDRTLIVIPPTNKVVECGTAWSFNPPVTIDSCGGLGSTNVIISTVTNSGACGSSFVATRTWEVIDACTNRTTVSQTVTAIDTTAPTPICAPNKTIEFGTAWDFDTPSGVDACRGTNLIITVLSTSTNAGPCGPGFTATREWQLSDACGNTSTCSQTVTVQDTTAPLLTHPLDKSVNCLQPWTFDPPTANDIGDGVINPVIFGTVTNGSCGAGYTVVRTWSATDRCGNTSFITQTVYGRAIVTVSGTFFVATNYPATLNDKRISTATVLGPTNSSAPTVANGNYNLVFDAANNVVLNTLPPTAGNPSDGVSTLDITLLRRHILNLAPLDNPYRLLAGDVDGSRSISTLDLSFVRRLVLGTTNRFPRGLWRFVPSSYVFTNNAMPWDAPTNRNYAAVNADTAGQDFVGIKLGDVNNSWTGHIGSSFSAPAKSKGATSSGAGVTNGVTLILPVTSGYPGDEIVVPIQTSGFTNVNGLQFTFHWQTNVVKFVQLEQFFLPGLVPGNFNLQRTDGHTNLPGTPGLLTVQWDEPNAGVVNLTEGAPIFSVRFRITGQASNSTPLQIDSLVTQFEIVNGDPAVVPSSAIDGSVFVKQTNRAPAIATIASQNLNEGSTLSFTPAFTDADGSVQTFTFSLDSAPAGASIDPVTGLFTWTPTEAQGPGNYDITVRVTDNGLPAAFFDTETFSVNVGEVNTAPVLAAVGDRSANEGGLLSFTATATDLDAPAQTLTFTLEGAPSGASITTGGFFTWTPTEAQGPSTNTFTVRVTDNGTPALNDFETITIVVGEANGAPVLGTIGSKSVNESNTLTFTAVASDSDNPAQIVSYSLSNAPAGAVINPSTGDFSWTPTEAQGPGTYFVTVIATDNGTPALSDSEVITITVNEVNLAPSLGTVGDRTVNELSALTFTAIGSDVDFPANVLTYSLSNAPSGATINPTTGAFTWTPNEAQGSNVYTFVIRVTDAGGLSVSETISVTVNEVPTSPVLAPIGNKNVNEGSLLTFTNSATDVDLPAQSLTYSLSNAPFGATINATNGVFTWTPTEAQGPSNFVVAVIVTDNGVPARSASETFVISVNEVGTAPVLGSIGSQSVSEGSLLTFTATATDADLPAQVLTYSLSNAPAGASITAGGVFTWTPGEVQGPGVYNVTVIVTDSTALTDSEVVSITVNEAATAPNLVSPGNRTVNEGALLTFNVTASDDDLPAQALTFSLEPGAPAGASITAGGVFTWTPTEAQGPGTYPITIRVTDSTTLFDTETISVTVNESNIAPTLALISDKTVVKNTLLTFTANGSDLDAPAQTLSYSLEAGAPTGASIDSATGVFSWTPTTAQGPNNYSITVRVSDNGPGSLSATRTFNVFVSNGNTPPVLAAIGNKQVTTLTELSFTAQATDAEITSQNLTYSLVNAPAGATIDPATGLFRWTPSEAQGPSTNQVTIRVSDNALNPESDEETISIVVLEYFAPNITITDSVVPAGTDGSITAEFEVSLSSPSARTVSVDYVTVGDSAIEGEDFTPVSGTLVFDPGTTNLAVDVEALGKSTVYTNRAFFVRLSNPTNAVIADDEGLGLLDANPAPGLYISDASVIEGQRGRTSVVFTVNLVGEFPGTVSVNYSTARDTAQSFKDFTSRRGKLRFLPGVTSQTISIPVVGELLSEYDESFFVNLSRNVGAVIIQGRGRGTIIDDDVLPTVSISDVSTTESDSGLRGSAFTVRLSARSGRPVSIEFSTSDGTAFGGTDYMSTNGTLVIPPGTSLKKIVVPVKGNRTSESNETFFVNLHNAVNATLAKSSGVANIRDNDRLPSARVSDAQVMVDNAGRYAAFTVTLSAPSERDVTLRIATAGVSAVADVDYQKLTETPLYFAPGVSALNVIVPLLDNPQSPGRSFQLRVISAVNAAIADGSGACVIPAP